MEGFTDIKNNYKKEILGLKKNEELREKSEKNYSLQKSKFATRTTLEKKFKKEIPNQK